VLVGTASAALATAGLTPVAERNLAGNPDVRVVVPLTLPGVETDNTDAASRPNPVTVATSRADRVQRPAISAPVTAADTPNGQPPSAANALVAQPPSPDSGGPAAARSPAAPAPHRVLTVTIRRGDSLYSVFKTHGVRQADLAAVMEAGRDARRLARLQPGDRVDLLLDAAGRLAGIEHPVGRARTLRIQREGGVFSATIESAAPPIPTSTPTRNEPGDAGAERVAVGTGASAGSEAVGAGNVSEAEPNSTTRYQLEVREGQSLYTLFIEHRLSLSDLAALLARPEDAKVLRRLRPGQRLDIDATARGSVIRLVCHLDESRMLSLTRDGKQYRSERVSIPLERRTASSSGGIESSLFVAGQRAGLADGLIMELVEIFAWDVDFALDIRSGDRFALVYDELYKDGKKVRDGEIMAAEFVNRGRRIRAVRFVDGDGRARYYSPEGMSMRKAFLRTPVKFTRISSRFSSGRLHPVLHRIRSHKGVDYAARTGTPVKATGDGKVAFRGRKGGYGRAVVLRHGATYTTLYAHLSSYARGVSAGKRVEQGDVIGYVGSSGMATGPHLHYEFRVRGVHRNPLTVELPKSAPLPEKLRPEFLRQSKPLLALLERATTTQLASND
jgi:murein DD-endopeptidase MepM/ murein hydrolase activator NlpD